MYNRAKELESRDHFNDIFKNDLITVSSVCGCHCLCRNGMSPYIGSLLKRGLNEGEMRDMVNPMVEESMVFTSAVGIELLHRINDLYNCYVFTPYFPLSQAQVPSTHPSNTLHIYTPLTFLILSLLFTHNFLSLIS
jgi:hypothetical protein